MPALFLSKNKEGLTTSKTEQDLFGYRSGCGTFRNCGRYVALMVAVMVVMTATCFSVAGSTDASDDESDYSEEEIRSAFEEEFALIEPELEREIQELFGITYGEYCEIIESIAGSAIYIHDDNGVTVAEFIEPTEAGKLDYKESGDYVTLYIDSYTLAALTVANSMISVYTLVNAVAPLLGLTGMIRELTTIVSGLVDFGETIYLDQYDFDHGIWVKIKVKGHVSVLGHKIYYPYPPTVKDWGPQ